MITPSLMRWARRWGLWVALPTGLNLALWWAVIGPQHSRIAQWEQARRMAQARPQLESLIAQSDQTLESWRREAGTPGDPQAVMQTLQRLADRHRVQLSDLNVRAASPAPGLPLSKAEGTAKAPIELEAGGSFHQLANWIGELETVPGMRLEQWTLTAASEPGQPHRAKLSLSALSPS